MKDGSMSTMALEIALDATHNAGTGMPVSGRIRSGFHVGKLASRWRNSCVNHAVGRTHSSSDTMDRSKADRPHWRSNGPREAYMTFWDIRNRPMDQLADGCSLDRDPQVKHTQQRDHKRLKQASGSRWLLVLSYRIQHNPKEAKRILALLLSVLIAKPEEEVKIHNKKQVFRLALPGKAWAMSTST